MSEIELNKFPFEGKEITRSISIGHNFEFFIARESKPDGSDYADRLFLKGGKTSHPAACTEITPALAAEARELLDDFLTGFPGDFPLTDEEKLIKYEPLGEL